MNQECIYKVLFGLYVFEKVFLVVEYGQVVFWVVLDVIKFEIKKVVEQLFNVIVEGVQVLNCKGKFKCIICGFGKCNDICKVYVKLVEGQDIDFLDVE